MNSAFVNHCVLTMMQHVAIELNDPDTLLTPKILCCFVELLNEPRIQIPEVSWYSSVDHPTTVAADLRACASMSINN